MPQAMSNRSTATCDECGSLFFADASRMDGLCPECAHLLYGDEACAHSFVDGRCARCYWDGSVSVYGQMLKRQGAT